MNFLALNKRLERLVYFGLWPEQIAGGLGFTGGPVWHHSQRTLLFSDIPNSVLYSWTQMFRWTQSGDYDVFREPSGGANGNTYDRSGRLITCEHGERRVSLTTKEGVVDLATEYEGMRLNSPNDVISLANGDVIFTDPTFGLRRPDGTVHGQQLPFAGVYRVSAADRSIRLLADDFTAPNGLALSDDGSKVWIDDTTDGNIRVFDLGEDGSLRNGKVFAELKQDGIVGRPGGMKLDSQGNLYVAGNTDDGVWVFSPEGEHLGFIRIDEAPANLAWGDDDWKTLYVAARTSIYRVLMRVPGQPVVIDDDGVEDAEQT